MDDESHNEMRSSILKQLAKEINSLGKKSFTLKKQSF